MKIVEPSFVIETPEKWISQASKIIERAGRTCYKSEEKISDDSDVKFLKHLVGLNHESVIEHFNVTVRFVCDRGVSHELVRHRLASFSQESTRFCNYSGDKFGNEITVIKPCFYDEGTQEYILWYNLCMEAEDVYFKLLKLGSKPQEARSILPNSLKTEIVVTANLREWKHIFRMRTSLAAHPQMREVMIPLLNRFKELVPVIYDDIEV